MVTGVTDIFPATMLAGRVAIVTGGARGIGRAIATTLLTLGADVVICGRQAPDTLPSAHGRNATFLACDVRQSAAVAAMIAEVGGKFGRIDIVVNNAGGSPSVAAAEASPRLSEAIIALNLIAPLHVATAAYPWLVASNDGTIVNIASISGKRPAPGTAAYGAAKAGLISLSQALAMEWGSDVRVNTIVVGLVAMENGEEHYGGGDVQRRIAATIPLRRMVAPDDVASAVAYLVSPLASGVTGAEVAVHGGGEVPAFVGLVGAR